MANVRAKFKCNLVTPVNASDGWQGTKVAMNAVGPTYGKDGKPVWPEGTDNQKWWESTPSGELNLWIQNPSAAACFEQGKEYFIDFTPAE